MAARHLDTARPRHGLLAHRGRVLVWTAVSVVVVGCACEGEPRDRPPRRAPETEAVGGDEGLFPPVGDPSLAPAATRFEPVDVALGREMSRARSWAGARALGGDVGGRDDVGNWLCRLVALWGPPPGTTDDGFRYVFHDAEIDRVLVAYADERGPAMGAVMYSPEGNRLGDEDRTAAAVDAFVALVEATRPADCSLEVGGHTVGMRDGRPIDD